MFGTSTSMLGHDAGASVRVRTPCGSVTAKKLVLALNAWMAEALPQFERSIAIVSSDMVITERCPELLRSMGLIDGVSVLDSRTFVHYYRSTPQGRLMLGKGGNTFAFANRHLAEFDAPSRYLAPLTRTLRRFFPALADVPIAASWCGASDRSVDGLPFFGHWREQPNVVYGLGYSGNGVAQSWMGGQILAALVRDDVREADKPWRECALVSGPRGYFPPEPFRYTKIDVTSQKLYTLTQTTKNLVKNLSEDVTIYVINSENSQDETLQQTLKSYAELSDHIKLVYKDPVVSPDFYKDYTDSISVNSMIVESAQRFKVINYNNIYEYDYDYSNYSSSVSGYDAEGQLTSAIAYVTSDSTSVVYELNGHGESSLDSSFEDGVKKENVDLAELTLLTEDSVPDDANGVLILSPTNDLNAEDADKLIAYLNNGGKVLISTSYIDCFSEEMPNLTKVLSEFGLSIGDGLIVEQDNARMYQNPIYLLPNVSSDSLTNGVYGKSYDYIMMPYAQPILTKEKDGVTLTTLLTTSEKAYSKTDLNQSSDVKKTEDDAQGPFTVGVKAVKTLASGEEAQLILYSSSYLFTESANQYTMDNNLTLFTNAISTMAGESESISIPTKSMASTYATVPTASAVRYGILLMGILPIGLLAAGIIIWVRRRKR